MFRVKLTCRGIPSAVGTEAASDITREFAEHRNWWFNVRCCWDGELLVLEADSDFDSDGSALADEFSDCVVAYVAGEFDVSLSVERPKSMVRSVRKLCYLLLRLGWPTYTPGTGEPALLDAPGDGWDKYVCVLDKWLLRGQTDV